MHNSKLITLFTVGTLLLGAAACGDSGGGDACVDYSNVTPGGSFKDDVLPIFQTSCNFSTCHGTNAASPRAGLALGPESGVSPGASDVTLIHQAIVGKDSTESSLKLVEAGDPGASWLLAKLEYDDVTACSTTMCTSGCGTIMPQGSAKLSEADLNKIRAWIADGAKDN